MNCSLKKSLCKATAILTVAFFVSSGIFVPSSFASTNELILDETRRPAPTLTLEQANAQKTVTQNVIPSGAVIQPGSPLSVASDLPTAANVPASTPPPVAATGEPTPHLSDTPLDPANQPKAVSFSEPVVLPTGSQQPTPDSGDLYDGSYNFGQIQTNGITVSQTSPGIYTYHKVSSYSWVGGAVVPAFYGNDYDYVCLEARSIVSGSNSFVFEVKNNSSYILRQTVSLQGTGWHTLQFLFPKDAAPVNFIAFSNPTHDFEIRDLRFSDTPVFTGTASIIQTSPKVTNALNYQLSYTLNGVSFQEAILLKEGNNTVTRTWVNASGKKASYSFSILADTVIPTGSINVNSSALYTASQTVTLNLSGTDTSSGISTMSFSSDNINWTEPVAYATSKTFTLPAGDGAKTVYVKYYDKAGNVSAVYSKSILLDTVQPTGAIDINSGAVYATSASVTLNLSGTDAGSGIAKMSFSTNNTTWTTPETYAASKKLTLPSGDGNKTVYVKYYDKAGNVSAVYSKSIVLDTLPPVGTIKVNGGAIYINQAAVTLDLSASDVGSGLSQMCFSTNGTTWTTAEDYAATKAWVFGTGDGPKKVYTKFQDKAGKWSSVVSVTVTLDTVKPIGSININSNALYAASQTVTLNLSGKDNSSGISAMSFSGDNINWTAPVAYATSKTFALPAGDGSKTIYVKYFDKAGNASEIYSKSIILDTLPPSGTVSVNGGAAYISQTAVTLGLSAADAGSGLSKMSFSTNGTTWTTAENYAATKAWTFTAGDGAKKVYVKFQDKSGKWSTPVFAQVLLDTIPPTGTLSINNNAVSTPASLVTLNLSGYDAGSGVDQIRFSADGGVNWSSWEAFSVSKSFSLPSGNGMRQVQCQLRDKAGLSSAIFSDTIVVDIQISSEWTQTTSNVNYVFRVQDEGSSRKLWILNVGNGQQTEVAELAAGTEYPRFQESLDVSPDGSTVIYGTLQSSGNGIVYVQRLGDPVKKISFAGTLRSITFISASENVSLDLMDGQSIVVRLPASPAELPQILEEHKPNGVVSYFNSSDGALERVAVQQTGGTAPVPTVQIVRPVILQTPGATNQYTLKFDQAMRGVRYEVQFTSDPASGLWQTAGSLVADRYGDMSWQDPAKDRGISVFYRVIPKEMTTAADLLTQIDLLYFDPAFGQVDSTHEYPVEGWLQRDVTQPSNFGFYAYLLATIAAGDLVTSTISKTEAIRRLDVLMSHLIEDQQALGYKGLLPWFSFAGSDWARMNDTYGQQVSFEDNSNLSNALAVAYGALLDDSLAGDATIHGNGGILGKIDAFIENQKAGYLALYNSGTNTFNRTMQIQDGSFSGGVIDYFGAESSAPLLFLILQYGDTFPASAYTQLNFATHSYTMQDGTTKDVVAPFSGAFHMYWPALLMPESQDADLRNMLETYTDVQLDYANRNGQPGFLSASYDVQAHDLLKGQLATFSFDGGNVSSSWESNHLHITSTNQRGVGVASIVSGLDAAGFQMQLRYASATAVPGARIEFKKKVDGVLTVVATQYLTLENTGGETRTVSFSLPPGMLFNDLEEVVFVTSGTGGALDMSLDSFVLMDGNYKIVYDFPLGIKDIAFDQTSTVETTPSVYNLGAAYMFRPTQVESLLQGLIADHRDLISNHGLWEGKNMVYDKTVNEQVFNNMATFILGMAGTGPSYMTRYLENKGLTEKLESIWNPQTPVSLLEHSTVNDFSYAPYKATAWKLSENVRASDRQIRFIYQSATAIQGVKLELKHPSSNVAAYTVVFDLPATGDVPGEFVLSIPDSVLYGSISEIVALFPEAQGFPSATITGMTLAPAGVSASLALSSHAAESVPSTSHSLGLTTASLVAEEFQQGSGASGVTSLETQANLTAGSLNPDLRCTSSTTSENRAQTPILFI